MDAQMVAVKVGSKVGWKDTEKVEMMVDVMEPLWAFVRVCVRAVWLVASSADALEWSRVAPMEMLSAGSMEETSVVWKVDLTVWKLVSMWAMRKGKKLATRKGEWMAVLWVAAMVFQMVATTGAWLAARMVGTRACLMAETKDSWKDGLTEA